MDFLSTRDRYARAVSADDLTPRAESRFSPLDVLGAAGMAAQRHELGMLLQRLRADERPNPTAIRVAAEALAERLRGAVRRREVRRDGVDSLELASQALDWWLAPWCLTCHGVKFQSVNGRLLDRHCPACSGTGLGPAPCSPAAQWVIETIQQQVGMSEAVHRRVLG